MGWIFLSLWKLKIDKLLGIVVIGISGRSLILLSSLCLAAIALLAKGEVEIIAVNADPITLSCLR
jgi:hypothetical protein